MSMQTILKIIIAVSAGSAAAFLAAAVSLQAARFSDVRFPRIRVSRFVYRDLLLLKREPGTGKPDRSSEARLCRVYACIGFFAGLLVTRQVIIALVFCAAGAAITGWYCRQVTLRWLRTVDRQLSDFLEMLAQSVAAGQSVLQGLTSAVERLEAPLSAGLRDALREVDLGTPLHEALNHFAARLDTRDIRVAIIAINLSRETGGNLSLIVSRLGETMRERRAIQGRITALTAQGRASGMLIGSAPLALLALLYMLEPGMMGLLFSTVPGNVMLAVAAAMVGTGLFFISKIVTIDI